MARPKKDKVEKLTSRIYIRCGADEVSLWKPKASSQGLSVSDYIRQLVERDSASYPTTAAKVVANDVAAEQTVDDRLVYELHRMGNNLNQLTKKYHSEGMEPPGLRSLYPVLERLLTYVFKRINVE